jgi:hypothetical protein
MRSASKIGSKDPPLIQQNCDVRLPDGGFELNEKTCFRVSLPVGRSSWTLTSMRGRVGDAVGLANQRALKVVVTHTRYAQHVLVSDSMAMT